MIYQKFSLNTFMISKSDSLSQAEMARLNQSIEALFIAFCVLGAQVKFRSFIVGNTGSAKEAQDTFLSFIMEDSIRQPDIRKSVQRFQLAIGEARVRLNLAIPPRTWLMPSDLEMNPESTEGYINN